MLNLRTVVLLFLIAIAGPNALAGTVTYSDAAAWHAAMQSVTYSEDFESVTTLQRFGGTTYRLGSVDYVSNASSASEALICVGNQFGCGGSGLTNPFENVLILASYDLGERLEIIFDQEVTGFSFDWFAPGAVPGRTLSASLFGEEFFRTPDASLLTDKESRTGFFGITSDSPFDTIVFEANANVSTMYLDNLQFGAASTVSVPAPAGFGLVLLSLLLMVRLTQRY